MNENLSSGSTSPPSCTPPHLEGFRARGCVSATRWSTTKNSAQQSRRRAQWKITQSRHRRQIRQGSRKRPGPASAASGSEHQFRGNAGPPNTGNRSTPSTSAKSRAGNERPEQKKSPPDHSTWRSSAPSQAPAAGQCVSSTCSPQLSSVSERGQHHLPPPGNDPGHFR